MNKPKVLVIFPKFDVSDSSHYPYWYHLFEEAGKELDIQVLFEQATGNVKLGNCKTITQKVSAKPFNLIERILIVLNFRLNGYTNIYIHYSYFSLFIAKFVTLLAGGKTFLWDCEYFEKTPVNKWQVRAIKISDVLVTGHQKIADQYRKILNLGNKPIEIVYNWVENKNLKVEPPVSSRGEQDSKQKFKNILFVHHLAPRKGSRDLPAIIEGVLAKRNDVQFTIVGDGPDYQWLKNWVADNNLETKVILKGKLSRSDTDIEFSNADLFILPSRSEGFPRVILEAQSWGIPYVSTDVGCVKEITPEFLKPYISYPKNTENFVNNLLTILKLINNNNLQYKLSDNSLEYNLIKSIDQFLNLFIPR